MQMLMRIEYSPCEYKIDALSELSELAVPESVVPCIEMDH